MCHLPVKAVHGTADDALRACLLLALHIHAPFQVYPHPYAALKANNCPVCNEIYAIDAVVSCRPVAGKNFAEAELNRIKLALKCHQEGDRKVYSC